MEFDTENFNQDSQKMTDLTQYVVENFSEHHRMVLAEHLLKGFSYPGTTDSDAECQETIVGIAMRYRMNENDVNYQYTQAMVQQENYMEALRLQQSDRI